MSPRRLAASPTLDAELTPSPALPCLPRPARWFGKCWIVVDMLKYEFDIEFDVRAALVALVRPARAPRPPGLPDFAPAFTFADPRDVPDNGAGDCHPRA